MVKKTTKKVASKTTKKKTGKKVAKKKTKKTVKQKTEVSNEPVEPKQKTVLEKPRSPEAPKKQEEQVLHLKVSKTLKEKLISKARMEGVSLEDFAGELLAEGLVLRAWEIMERKSTMTKGSGNSNYNNNNHKNNHKNNRYNNNRQKRNHGNNNRRYNNSGNSSVVDDNANFMEYLRKQEQQQR